ncbi:MAG: alpha/beta fold hydrolase [Zoogloeaceae bacterium]|nr:alpha/beta fold hydrolase [Rhodocyclaceae bacterium]MCP5233485.1 alpha/beta fold hydrolase [Zoogloeaceae bacterium]MCP5311643.1 alpha/beta fold hydrolase [Zoogloeaceae bacterium]
MNTATKPQPRLAEHENSVPFFWPFTAAAKMVQAGEELVARNLNFALEAEKIDFGLHPDFATANMVRLDLHTLRLRDFSAAGASGIPTIVDAPFAGHSSTIADYHKGQSLVETLLANGLQRVFVTDWKSATPEMKDYDIDHYLAELLVCIDDLGGRVNLVGLCQGGWMSTMIAARFPDKVNRLVLAGSPIDTDAGHGPIRELAHTLPASFYEELVEMGGGLMEGRFMLQGWKNMHPDVQYMQKYLELYEHMNDPDYLSKTETFEAWYENPIDLPGRWYLQAINQLFKENRLAKGEFVGLGKKLDLADITCPTYLLAGASDDITTREQVFAARDLLGTPKTQIVSTLCPGGHIGLFMGSRTLKETWPGIGRWLADDPPA